MVLDSSDEEFINGHVDECSAAQEKAMGKNQKKKCNSNKCSGKEVIHRTCGSCNEIKCKDCNLHLQCPGCDKWFCEKDCCSSGSSSAGLYYCQGCGVICEGCITFLYEYLHWWIHVAVIVRRRFHHSTLQSRRRRGRVKKINKMAYLTYIRYVHLVYELCEWNDRGQFSPILGWFENLNVISYWFVHLKYNWQWLDFTRNG